MRPAGWDEYEEFVVSARTPAEAKGIHPRGDSGLTDAEWVRDWVLPAGLNATLLGVCNHKRPRVVVASFNAG